MRLASVLTLAVAAALVSAAASAAPAQLSAEQIIAKNVAARGGLEAWRKIETLVCVGHLRSEQAPLPSMGFTLEQKRPNKTRFELLGMNQKSVRVFDGGRGWTIHGAQNGPSQTKPFSPEELLFAEGAPGLAGPLIDYAAQGSRVTFEGVETLQGGKSYRLGVHRSSGEIDHVWVDAKTYLDVRYDRPSARKLPTSHPVSVYYSDYRAVAGIQIAAIIETGASPGRAPDRMTIERVVVNSPLEDTVFTASGGGSMSRSAERGRVAAPLPAMATPTSPSSEPTSPPGGTAEATGK
jgi:hypothetical protein